MFIGFLSILTKALTGAPILSNPNIGKIIVNTDESPESLGLKGDFEVHTVDANCIAKEIFGKPIINTIMIGAFAKITGDISLESLNKAIDDQFLETKGEKIANLNKQAIEKIYEEAK